LGDGFSLFASTFGGGMDENNSKVQICPIHWNYCANYNISISFTHVSLDVRLIFLKN